MTYGELLAQLYELNPEQLQQTVTIKFRADDEFYPINKLSIITEDEDDADVLDAGHPYLTIAD